MSQKLKTMAEEKLFSRNFTKYGLDMNPVVSIGAGLIVILFALFAFVDLERANKVFNIIGTVIVSNFDWLFVLSSNFFILVSLISAGMGIGLMFWSVGEPLYHVMQKPPIFDSNMSDAQAMATTFFHWSLHPWGIYALISLALAVFFETMMEEYKDQGSAWQ